MYRLDLDPIAESEIATLPKEALSPLAEFFSFLEITPWSGDPINADNPDGGVLTHQFGGHGMAIYLVLEARREVCLLRVHWI